MDASQTNRAGRKTDRYWRWAALTLGVIVFGIGCNPGSITYMLMPWVDTREAAEFKLARSDKEVTVAVVCNFGKLDPRPEYLGAEMELCEHVISMLKKRVTENKEKVKVVPASQVKAYLNQHLDVDNHELGKHFKADYVIVLEIQAINLAVNGSGGELNRGTACIDVTVLDIAKEQGQGSVWAKTCSCEYPPLGPITGNRLEFRRLFFHELAKKITRDFTAYPHVEAMENRGRKTEIPY